MRRVVRAGAVAVVLACVAAGDVIGVPPLVRAAAAAPQDRGVESGATVTGEVLDPAGQRIVGAAVVLEVASGARREASTDASGEFRFTDIPAAPIA